MVSNLIALNSLVQKDPLMLRNMKEVLESVCGSKWFSVIDLQDAFYSIEIEEQDKHKTAFEFGHVVYEFNVMAIGFKNAPQILQKITDKTIENLKFKYVEIYMDDIVVHATTQEKHDLLLDKVLKHWKRVE